MNIIYKFFNKILCCLGIKRKNASSKNDTIIINEDSLKKTYSFSSEESFNNEVIYEEE